MPSPSPGQPVRLLLINPKFPKSFWNFHRVLKNILPNKRALNPPQADIVDICAMAVQFQRQSIWNGVCKQPRVPIGYSIFYLLPAREVHADIPLA